MRLKQNSKALLGSVFVFLLAFSVNTSGKTVLPEKIELTRRTIVRAIGVDKTEDGTGMTVTFTPSLTGDQSKEASQEKNPEEVIVSTGETFFEAVRKAQTFSSKSLTLGHTKLVVFGEDAAKDDISQYIDYLSRDNDLRMNLYVVVAKGLSARSVLECRSSDGVTSYETIISILEESDDMSYTSIVRLSDVVQGFERETCSPYLPSVLITKTDSTPEGMGRISLNGYGIFRGQKLVGYLERELAQAFTLYLNKLRTAVVTVKDEQAGILSLELKDASCETSVDCSTYPPSFTMEVAFDASIYERINTPNGNQAEHGDETLFINGLLERVKQSIEGKLSENFGKLLTLQRTFKTDFLRLGDVLYHASPQTWQSLAEKWDELLPELDVTIHVQADVNNFYLDHQE